jgi:hypothetical protein
MEKLFKILQNKLWVEVSPAIDTHENEWIAAIYKRKNSKWIAEMTKGEFRTAQDAYDWALGQVESYEI